MMALQCPVLGTSQVVSSRPQSLLPAFCPSGCSSKQPATLPTSHKPATTSIGRIVCKSAVAAAPSSEQPPVAAHATAHAHATPPKPGSIVQGVVKTVEPKITVELSNGFVSQVPGKQISGPARRHTGLKAPPFHVGEEVYAVVAKGSPVTLSTAALEVLPNEILDNKAAVFSRVKAFMQGRAALEGADSPDGQPEDAGDISAYHDWLGTQLLSQFLAPATPSSIGASSSHRPLGWYDVRPGQLLQARVLRVVRDLVTLRVDSLGINGKLHVSQISHQLVDVKELPQLLQAGTQVMVLVKKLDPPIVPGAAPRAYFSMKELEGATGVAAVKDLKQYNEKAAAAYMQLQQRWTQRALATATEALNDARQAEAVRQRNASKVVLTAGSIVSGTVTGSNEYGVLVRLPQPGAERMLLHTRNISQQKVSVQDACKLLPEGTEVTLKVIMAKVGQQQDGAPKLRPALSLKCFESVPGEFKINASAVLQRAADMHKKQQASSPQDSPQGSPQDAEPQKDPAKAGATAAAAAEAAAEATAATFEVTFEVQAGPRFQRLLQALRALLDVSLYGIAAGNSTRLPAAAAQAEAFLQLVQEAEQLISSSLGNKMPWEVKLQGDQENNLSAGVNQSTMLWSNASDNRTHVMAALLALRFKARAVRMLQDPTAAAQVLSSNKTGIFDRDMLALSAAAVQLPEARVLPVHMAVILNGLISACHALHAHPNKQVWEDAYTAWVHPAGSYLQAALTSQKLDAGQVLDSQLLPALTCTRWAQKQRALSHTEHTALLDTVLTRLRKRLMPNRIPYPEWRPSDSLKGTSSTHEQQEDQGRAASSPSSAAAAQQPQQQSSSLRLEALQYALALLQIASNVGYVPSAEWWSSLFKGLLLRAPEVLQPSAAWSNKELAVIKQLKSATAYLTNTKSVAKPSESGHTAEAT